MVISWVVSVGAGGGDYNRPGPGGGPARLIRIDFIAGEREYSAEKIIDIIHC